MMEDGQQLLSGDDLARPAKHLPLKVIRELGRKLHRQHPTSGNWETLAEDLGYGFEEIHQFSSLASMRQESTPGETMLLDWVQRGNNCTLFVLRSALSNADRQDCVEYLDQEVYARVICMDLLVCIKDESTKETEHISIRTRSDGCLIDSLRHNLLEPISHNYILLDRNASWVNTLAREFKGRELMLLKRSSEVPMEQDPTIDSSNPSLGTPGASENTRRLGLNAEDLSDPCYVYQRNPSDPMHLSSQSITNDLNLVKQLPRSDNHPVNIVEGTSVCVNAFKKTGLTNDTINKNMSEYSDELNVNYPWTASDCDNLRDSTRIPSENLDQCDLNAEFSEYNDPTALIGDTNSNINKFSQRKEIHGVPLVEYSSQPGQQKEDSDTMLYKLNDTDHIDPVCTHMAEYEDPSIYRPEIGNDNTPEYNYAVDVVCLEKDDSLTELKRVILSENPTDFNQFHNNCFGENLSENAQVFQAESKSNLTHYFSDDAIYNEDMSSYKDPESVFATENDREAESHSSQEKPQITNETIGLMTSSDENIYRTKPFNDMDDSNYIDSDQNTFDLEQGNTSFRDSQIGNSTANLSSVLTDKTQTAEGAYIDFNKYPQIPSSASRGQEKPCVRRNAYRVEMRQKQNMASARLPTDNPGDTMKRVRFGDRCVSTVETAHTQYEMLDRQTSCPNFEYSSSASARHSNSIDFATIAEVFSPAGERTVLQDSPTDIRDKNNYVPETFSDSPKFETDRHFHGKRYSFPGTDPGQTALKDKFKFARHSFPVTRNIPEKHISTTSRPLPSVPSDSNEVLTSQTSSLRRNSSHMSTRPSCLPDDNYRTVIGGKTSRPLLDHCLANDYLFTHYNNELRGYRCWSPKETEYTVHKTLGDVKHEDGMYIYWYHRSKKNLIITVTDRGELLHFRVRTKVQDKHLYHFVTHAKMFADVHQLIEHHHDNGLYVDKDKLVFMRLPVCVKYDRIPVSV